MNNNIKKENNKKISSATLKRKIKKLTIKDIDSNEFNSYGSSNLLYYSLDKIVEQLLEQDFNNLSDEMDFNVKEKLETKIKEILQNEVDLCDIEQGKYRTGMKYVNLILIEILSQLSGNSFPITDNLYNINTEDLTNQYNNYNLNLKKLTLLQEIASLNKASETAKKKLSAQTTKLKNLKQNIENLKKDLEAKNLYNQNEYEKSLKVIESDAQKQNRANDKLKDEKEKSKKAKSIINLTSKKTQKTQAKLDKEIANNTIVYQKAKDEEQINIEKVKQMVADLEKKYNVILKKNNDDIKLVEQQINALKIIDERKISIKAELEGRLEDAQNKKNDLVFENLSEKEFKAAEQAIDKNIKKLEKDIYLLSDIVPDNNKERLLVKINALKWGIKPSPLPPSGLLLQWKHQKKVFAVTFNPNKQNRDTILKAIKYLLSYNLIALNDSYKYELNLKYWFKFQKHQLSNSTEIANLLPLLVAFLKYNAPNRIDNFLSHIDNIVSYAFQEPKNFSSASKKEAIVLKAINEFKKLKIHVEESQIDTIFKDVSDVDIFFDEDYNKVLSWTSKNRFTRTIASIDKISLANSNPELYIQFSNLKIENAIENKKKLNIHVNELDKFSIYSNVEAILDKKNKTLNWEYSKHNCFLEDIHSISIENEAKDTEDLPSPGSKGFMVHKEKYNIPDKKNYKTILEVDIDLADFFDVRPLENQMMYKTEAEKEQFCKANIKDTTNDYPQKNKIYVTALDQTDAILHVVKRCIPGVKIIEPAEIKEKFEAIIKLMCKDMK